MKDSLHATKDIGGLSFFLRCGKHNVSIVQLATIVAMQGMAVRKRFKEMNDVLFRI